MSDLITNYETLAADRGWSHDLMAEHIATLDPKLAAQYREAHAKDEAPAAPKSRRSKADTETVEG